MKKSKVLRPWTRDDVVSLLAVLLTIVLLYLLPLLN